MKPELERRVTMAFKQAAVVLPKERDQIVQDVQDADTFQDLPPDTQSLIVELEDRTPDRKYDVVAGVVVSR